MINDEQCQQFHRDGYLIARQMFSRDEMDVLLKIGRSDPALLGGAYDKQDADGGASRLTLRQELVDDDIYCAIARCRRLVDAMTALLGDEIYHWHHKMMMKEPRVGGAWEWHQDYGYWYNGNNILFPDLASACVAVDPATKQNGCLQLISGSHKMGRIEHGVSGSQVGADLQRVEAALEHPAMSLVYAELDPGDVLFFHSNTLHRSDANKSDNPRWSLICCYNTRHNSPMKQPSNHPAYSPLEVLDDDRVLEVGRAQWAKLQAMV